jgi:uncharacterized membrane protein
MRILSLVVSFLVMVSLATATLFYVEQRVGQSRVQVQQEWLTSADEPALDQPAAYRRYGQ